VRVELVTVVIQVAETNITDRHEWAGFRGGEEGREGCILSLLPPFPIRKYFCSSGGLRYGWIGGYLSCGDMVLKRW